MNDETNDSVGAYGLRVEGISQRMRAFLGRAGPDWPPIRLHAGEPGTDEPDVIFTEDRARVPLPGGGEIVVQRSPLVGEVRPAVPLREEELLHPYLGYVAVIAARWLGRDCVHAGAFVVDGGAWAFVGARATGKSSMLGRLAADGYDVVCDDVVVIDEQCVFAGPRFVDLRAETAERLGRGEPIGMVGARERWRLRLDPIPPELPLRGWVFLEWGGEGRIERVGPGESMMRIKQQLSLFTTPREPAALLDLAALPAWRLRRPHSWQSMDDAVRRLVDALRS
jgi:hypothetical protein